MRASATVVYVALVIGAAFASSATALSPTLKPTSGLGGCGDSRDCCSYGPYEARCVEGVCRGIYAENAGKRVGGLYHFNGECPPFAGGALTPSPTTPSPTVSECTHGQIDQSDPCFHKYCIMGKWSELHVDCPRHFNMPCDGEWVKESETACCEVCKVKPTVEPTPEPTQIGTTDPTPEPTKRQKKPVHWCPMPQSSRQICKMRCDQPRCGNENRCAKRLGNCCDYRCAKPIKPKECSKVKRKGGCRRRAMCKWRDGSCVSR